MHRVAHDHTGVIVGVDTHQDQHAVVLLDQVGQLLGSRPFPATPPGYQRLLGWAAGHGTIAAVAIEGANTYGAGLTRAARARGLQVLEVTRPERKRRDGRGKSDPIDAEAAARSALAGPVESPSDENPETARTTRYRHVVGRSREARWEGFEPPAA